MRARVGSAGTTAAACTPTRSTSSRCSIAHRRRSLWRAPPRPTPIICQFGDDPDATRGALSPRRYLFLQAQEIRGGGRHYLAVGQVEAGGKLQREALLQAIAPTKRCARDQRRRQKSLPDGQEDGRGDRSLRQAVSERSRDRRHPVQKRRALLRPRRIRRSGETLWFDRRRISQASGRGAGGRQDPRVAEQGQGLRERRELGAAPVEGAGVSVEGRSGAPLASWSSTRA